ncbi:MAG: PAS domain S-box protein [Bacteroidota bacterium]
MKRKTAIVGLLLWISNSVGAFNDHTKSEMYEAQISEMPTCSNTSQASDLSISSYFSGLLTTDYWPARWTCGDWSSTEGWLYISADLSIFLAYLSIPIILFWFIRKIQLGRLRWLIALFSAFILLCGFTHLLDVVLFWEPMYRLSGFAKLVTGAVSLCTATTLGFVIPRALTYKSSESLQKEIEERKKIQNQLESFIKYSPGAMAMFDNDMKYIMANDRWYKDYGLGDMDIIGKSHYDVFPIIREMPRWIEDHQRALNGETLKSDFDTFEHAGNETYLSWRLTPWYNADNSIGGIMMFTEVITDEVLIKKRLVESEQRFTNIFNKAHLGIALVDSNRVPFVVNPQLCEIIGYTEDELLKMTFDQLTHPDDLEKDTDLYTKLLADEIDSYTIEKRYVGKDEKLSFVKLNVTWSV